MHEDITVLLVDDNKEYLKILERTISKYVKNISYSYDGDQALDLYKRNRPDIIFSDISMPNSNGIDFIKKVRKNDKETVIIIVSAHTNTTYLLEAVELGLLKFLVKPIDADELKTVLLESCKQVNESSHMQLDEQYHWDTKLKVLFSHENKINLTNYEILLIEILIINKNRCVMNEDIHNYVYGDKEYSLNAITSIIKRLRKKIPKDMLKSCYKEGYKIELNN